MENINSIKQEIQLGLKTASKRFAYSLCVDMNAVIFPYCGFDRLDHFIYEVSFTACTVSQKDIYITLVFIDGTHQIAAHDLIQCHAHRISNGNHCIKTRLFLAVLDFADERN